MRREHSKEEDKLIKFLREHNCVFYSPLSQNDTSDWISGNAMVKYANDSVVWDSEHDIWKFQKASGQYNNDSSYFAKWTLKEPIIAANAEFTFCANFCAYKNLNIHNVYDLLPTREGRSLYGTNNVVTDSAQWMGIINNESVQKQYRNGSLVGSVNYNSIVQYRYNTGLRIGVPRNDSGDVNFSGPYGVRNAAYFLKSLTEAEINEYFNIVTA